MRPRYITFAGQERPLYFGFNALWKFEKLTGTPISKIGGVFEDLKIEHLAQMLHIGFCEGARIDKVDFALNLEEVMDAMDQYGVNNMDKLVEALTEFFAPQEEGGEEKPGEALTPPVSQ